MLRQLPMMVAILFLCSSAYSQANKIKINSSQRIFLEYTSKSWNKNPNSVDRGALILRDGISKKLARIELFETDMDSEVFRGQYLVDWGDKEISPEIYLPPRGTGTNSEQLIQIQTNIENGSLLRKPFFIRSSSRISQIVTIFDTKEQALKAYENYLKVLADKNAVDPTNLQDQTEMSRRSSLDDNLGSKKILDDQQLTIQEAEIIKRQRLQEQQAQLDATVKAQRAARAEVLAKEGLQLYTEKKYPEAERKFEQATTLDPSNDSFYYQYAIVLMQNDKNLKSISLFNLATGPNVNPTEKSYYLGLNYLKLQESEKAYKNFLDVKNSADKTLGPAGAFYLGIIEFQKEEYSKARAEFEYVLDNSSDANMDKQAENYIEQIANAMAFKEEQKKKFFATLNFGLMYDSNILSTQSSLAGSGFPTDLAGYRWTYGGNLTYRPIYEYTKEMSVILSASDMYSTNNSFTAEKRFQNTDPLILGLNVPYKIKGKAFEKGYQGSFAPGYETILMNADAVGQRETIVNSTFLKTDHTFIMSDTWFSTYLAEIRQDASKLAATGDDDASAMKYTLGTTQTRFQDDKKTKILVGDFSLSSNQAKGANNRYFRYDLGLAYLTPWVWSTMFTGKISYFEANYNQHTIGRIDRSTGLILGLSRPIMKGLTGSVTGIYTLNNSTLPSSDYKKYIIMSNLSWTTSL